MLERRWSTKTIARAIAAFHKREGRWPKALDFRSANELPSKVTVEKSYQRLSDAIVAAGGPAPQRTSWTRELLLAWVKEFRSEHDRWPTSGDLEDGPPRWGTFLRFWPNGLTGAIDEIGAK